jgi:hypothetical protein
LKSTEFGQYKEFKNLEDLHNFIGKNKFNTQQSKIERNWLIYNKNNTVTNISKNQFENMSNRYLSDQRKTNKIPDKYLDRIENNKYYLNPKDKLINSKYQLKYQNRSAVIKKFDLLNFSSD